MARTDRFARAAAARAEAEGRDVPKDIAATAEAARENERQADLGNAQTQAEILNASEMRVNLLLFGVSKEKPEGEYATIPIRVPLEFTLGDILHRNVLREIDSFAALLTAEFRAILPPSIAASSANLFVEQPAYLTAAVKRPMVQNALFDIIAKIATTIPSDGEKPRAVTAYELLNGMEQDDVVLIAVRFLSARAKDQVMRKNARAAMGAA